MTRIEKREHRRPRPAWRDVLRLVLAVAAFVVLVILLRPHVGTMEAWLRSLGWWAPVVFAAVHVVVVSVGFPVSVLGFVAGATFGFLGASALLLGAGLLAAALMFGVSRRWLAPRVRRYAASRPRLARFMMLAEADAWRIMVLLRFSPLHFAALCYLLGASRVRFWPYLVTSACLLPSALLQAYAGWTARRLGDRAAAGAGLSTVETVLSVVGLAAAAALLVVMGRLARKALDIDQDGAT